MPAVLAIVGGIAAWAAYNWLQAPVNATLAGGEVEAKVQEVAKLGEELRFSMPPISSYDAILKRPIFAPNRRAVAGPKAVIVNQELGIELLGIVGDLTEPRILVKPSDGGESISLRVGEDYRGWTFERFEENKVTFQNAAGEEEFLELDFEKAPQPTAESRRDKRRQQAQQALQKRQRLRTGVVPDEEPEDEDEEAEQNQ